MSEEQKANNENVVHFNDPEVVQRTLKARHERRAKPKPGESLDDAVEAVKRDLKLD